jgi:hypothetical protein
MWGSNRKDALHFTYKMFGFNFSIHFLLDNVMYYSSNFFVFSQI